MPRHQPQCRRIWRTLAICPFFCLFFLSRLSQAAALQPLSLLPSESIFASNSRSDFEPNSKTVPPQDSQENPPKSEAPSPAYDSPQVALRRFLELCQRAKYREASDYLELAEQERERGIELSRRLSTTLHVQLGIDPKNVSPLANGDPNDGLAANLERIGELPGPAGALEPVLLVRQHLANVPWQFNATTVSRIDTWYTNLDYNWLLDRLPAQLLRPGPQGILWWQWMVLFGLLGISILVARKISHFILRRLIQRVLRQLNNAPELVLEHIDRPLRWMIALSLFFAATWMIELNPRAQEFLNQALRFSVVAIAFWILASAADVGNHMASATRWASDHPIARALLPLAARAIKFLIFALIAIGVISALGYPVASLLTGLGLGGLAFALAAQKTVENVFGAISIGVDQPFREGDFIKIDNFVGSVETIGLRSTRFRTLDRTLIAIPNGRVADMRIENYGARDRIRLSCTLGLVYSTTPAQMRTILNRIDATLRQHPKIWPTSIAVKFNEISNSSFNIEVMAWFMTANWDEFQEIRQELLLEFMEIVERAGSQFALPTQVVRVAGSSSSDSVAEK